MAGGGDPQKRLDDVVSLIANDMVAEVCSCYVLRAGEVLELFGTKGLQQSAVHKTRLRVGEGLIGQIAASATPLLTDDAQSHPAFAYRPETGEEVYNSFLGVPIKRNSRMIGVLAIQNVARRSYEQEELETLETVAMVLAELLTVAGISHPEELAPVDGNALLPMRLEGTSLSQNIGIGTAVVHRPVAIRHQLISEDPDQEHARLKAAIQAMQQSLDSMLSRDAHLPSEYRDILETYRMFAEDRGWISRITDKIKSGLTAEASVQAVADDMAMRMAQVSDPYIRERLHDLEDLANRLLGHLAGTGGPKDPDELPEDMILLARAIGPAELMDYDSSRLRGIILEEGSPQMHAAIVARAMGIPMVARVNDVFSKINDGDPVIVDGNHGQAFVRPSDDVVDAFQSAQLAKHQKQQVYQSLRHLPATSQDGVTISLRLNAGLLLDLPQLDATNADGIGLYRTELPFMARPSLPNVDDQTELYRKILEEADGKPVIFRTLDVGGDKVLPYWNNDSEDNPALGWRSIRITLDRPAILRHQLRALVRAAAGQDLYVMFPMIANVSEFAKAKHILKLEIRRAQQQGQVMPQHIKVGTMIEVPSVLWQMADLMAHVDFVSVGSNDLLQFLFAVDRGNPRLDNKYDFLSAPMLAALQHIVQHAKAANVGVSICGEMAGKPLEAMVLVALGFDALSMSAPSIGPIKEMVRSLNVGKLRAFLETVHARPHHSLKELLRGYAVDNGVILQ
jgi:phosphotransferase system enzyme I (PtsP)